MAKAPHKLDIFKTLTAIDRRKVDFYENLTAEEKKGFAVPVIMRWLSATQDQGGTHSYYLHMVNEFVNKNLWQLAGKHNELVYQLMASCGTGKKERHEWIKVNKTKSKIDQWLTGKFPGSNALELKLIKRQLDREQFKELVQSYATPDKEEKALMLAWKKEQS